MSDDVDKSGKQNSADSDADTSVRAGERLAAARKEQQISVLEIAKELHLDEPKVRALEQNNFEMLGAPVFAKGHLRKYAMLVGVDIDDVLQDYYQLNRSSGMPPVVGKVRKPAREIAPGPWIAAIAAILLVAVGYFWFATQDVASNIIPAQPEPANVSFNADEIDLEPDATIVELPDNSVAEAMAAQPLDVMAQNTAVQVVAVPEATVGEIRLTLQYSGDCWTEITDADGRQLFFDLGRDGRTANISGQAPLSVLFGNADHVSVRVNGRDYAISAADRRGDTARLTIQSP